MQANRFVWFTIMILLGAVGGMYYGWVMNPVRYVDTAPESLRQDYKADYALMVAEVYSREGSLPLAQIRLERLGSANPLRAVQEAILVGQRLGYSPQDMDMLAALAEALSGLTASTNTPPAVSETPSAVNTTPATETAQP
ncbi:hypothetical protein EG834_17505 [bacterium]|nr:hypothetical protein [bacterium]